MSYQIVRRQSTYWDLQNTDGLARIHFEGKEEFHFVEPLVPTFTIEEEHPLLVDYQFPWEHLYVAEGIGEENDVLWQLTQTMEASLDGWRSARHYFNPFGADRILREGYGQLLSGPQPVTEACRLVLEAAGVRVRCLPSRPTRWPRKVLVAGKNFVVAKSFLVEGKG